MINIIEKARKYLNHRSMAYKTTFRNPIGEEVLEDLAKFCRAHQSTFNPDARIEALMEGRREVWLRIAHHLNLSEEELWKLYGNPPGQK